MPSFDPLECSDAYKVWSDIATFRINEWRKYIYIAIFTDRKRYVGNLLHYFTAANMVQRGGVQFTVVACKREQTNPFVSI